MVLSVGSRGVQTTLLYNHARANRFVNRATERLSTSLRINHASDDPAGLIAAEKSRSDLIDIDARRRVNDALRGKNRIQQSRLQASSEVLHEMRGLALQSSGNTRSEAEQNAIQSQIDSSLDALESIASSGGTALQPVLFNLRTGGTANIADGDVAEAVAVLDQQLADNTASRLAAGVYEKYTLDVDQRLADAQAVATASSLSSTEDADYAQESSNLVVGGILSEAAIKTLALSRRIQLEQASAIFDNLF